MIWLLCKSLVNWERRFAFLAENFDTLQSHSVECKFSKPNWIQLLHNFLMASHTFLKDPKNCFTLQVGCLILIDWDSTSEENGSNLKKLPVSACNRWMEISTSWLLKLLPPCDLEKTFHPVITQQKRKGAWLNLVKQLESGFIVSTKHALSMNSETWKEYSQDREH